MWKIHLKQTGTAPMIGLCRLRIRYSSVLHYWGNGWLFRSTINGPEERVESLITQQRIARFCWNFISWCAALWSSQAIELQKSTSDEIHNAKILYFQVVRLYFSNLTANSVNHFLMNLCRSEGRVRSYRYYSVNARFNELV